MDSMADGRAPEVLAVAIIFFILSWVTIGLRVWVRAGMLTSFGLDDWTMVATQMLFTAYLACQIGGVVYGTGRHLQDLEIDRAEKAMKFWFFCELFYILATSMLKISIGFFLLRVAQSKTHIWIVRFIMIVTIVFGTAFFFVVTFQCNPIRGFWTLDPHDAVCINVNILNGLTYTISSLNVIADWVFGLLPFWIVKDLQMSQRQKRLVAALLAFAAIGSTATIVRLPFVGTLTESYLGWNGDFLYDTVGVAIWTTVEVGIGITAGCIACLRPIVTFVLSKMGLKSTTGGSSMGLSRVKKAKSKDAHLHSMSLGGLQPHHGVVTTITGNQGQKSEKGYSKHSRSDSQEYLTPVPPMPGDITKFVMIETDEYDAYTPTKDGSVESVSRSQSPPRRH